MFKAKQKLVHPRYGAGTVVQVLSLTVGDTKQKYYRIDLIIGDELLLPVESEDESGLMSLSEISTSYLDTLDEEPQPLSANRLTRQADIAEKLNSGVPEQVAEVYRDLMWHKKQKNLSTTDQKLMERARNFLASIRAASSRTQLDSATQNLSDRLNKSLASRVSAAAES